MSDTTPTVLWTITIDRANTVLAVLGEQPFNKVADLVMDLRTQAARQMQTWQQARKPGNGADTQAVQ